LRSAFIENKDIENQMEVEDDYLKEIIQKNNQIDFLENKLDEEQKLRLEKESELKKKDSELKEKDTELQEMRKSMFELARILKLQGKSKLEIIHLTKLSESDIEEL
jgi:hypothetical protein